MRRLLRLLWLEGRLTLRWSAWLLLFALWLARMLEWPSFLFSTVFSPLSGSYWTRMHGAELGAGLLAVLLSATLLGQEWQWGTWEGLKAAPRSAIWVFSVRLLWLGCWGAAGLLALVGTEFEPYAMAAGSALWAGGITLLLSSLTHFTVGLGVGLGWWSWSAFVSFSGNEINLPSYLAGLLLTSQRSETVILTLLDHRLPSQKAAQLLLGSLAYALALAALEARLGTAFDGLRRRRLAGGDQAKLK